MAEWFRSCAYLLAASFEDTDLRGTGFEDVDCDQASFGGRVFEGDGDLPAASTRFLVERARPQAPGLSVSEDGTVTEDVPAWRWREQ